MASGAQVPFIFKYAVDGLTMDPTGMTPVGTVVVLTPAMLIAGYGAARAGSALCNELRNATFAKVSRNGWPRGAAALRTWAAGPL